MEWEREEQYFSYLEEENVEERMKNIEELKVYVSNCKKTCVVKIILSVLFNTCTFVTYTHVYVPK